MVDNKINKLIEKFIDVKESKGFTEEQVAKLSGFTPLRIHNLFNGKVVHPSFDLTTKVAKALEIPFDEVSETLGLNAPNNIEVGCECYVGMLFDYENTNLITREELEELIKSGCSSAYTREQYCDKDFSTTLVKFEFCPKCGTKIDWDEIREDR